MNQHELNRSTLITVHGYAGDQHQIVGNLPSIEHHKLPIVVFSPEDAPITHMGSHICRTGGKRAYVGQDSLDRQLIHMRMMLEYKFDFYLMHDSDSLLLSPEIPAYVYTHPHEVFSNEVNDFRVDMPIYGPEFHKPLPQIAMQPPYFMSRRSLERMVEVGPTIKMCPVCPFIDWYMVQLVCAAGLNHSRYLQCVSFESTTPGGVEILKAHVSRGCNFVHYVKRPEIRKLLQDLWNKNHQ